MITDILDTNYTASAKLVQILSFNIDKLLDTEPAPIILASAQFIFLKYHAHITKEIQLNCLET